MQHDHGKRRLIDSLSRDIHDRRVIQAMAAVRREAFVPADLADNAYNNTPLPIGAGQTISQPLMVAIMLQALAVQPSDAVLDVGSGSGYQAAVLSKLARWVVGTERVGELIERSRSALQAEGCKNVEIVEAGETLGVPGRLFEGVVVGAAAPSVPQSLFEQLAEGGRLVIPVGTPFEQQLVRVVRHGESKDVGWLGPCRFVPLIGPEGWPEDTDFPREGSG
jgi:protein-L-isoaspartate(D-aspartate) O-methyltransferase